MRTAIDFVARWSVWLFSFGLAALLLVQDDLRGARTLAFATLTGMLLVFVLFFAFGSPWWRTIEGQALLAYMVALTLVCLQQTATLVFGATYPGRMIVSTVLIYGVTITAAQMFYLLLRNQRNTRANLRRLRRQRAELEAQIREETPSD